MCRTQVAMLMLLIVLPAFGHAQTPKYDGSWWLAQRREVQEKFLVAYGDCYVDTLGAGSPPPVDEYLLRDEITKFYRSGGSRCRSVAAVMKAVWQRYRRYRKPVRPENAEAEVWTEKHGFFDGLYWRGMDPAERLAFVGGLLACFNRKARSDKKFSEAPAAYVRHLDTAYQAARRQGAKADDIKIMDAFLQFANAPKESSVPKSERKPGTKPTRWASASSSRTWIGLRKPTLKMTCP